MKTTYPTFGGRQYQFLAPEEQRWQVFGAAATCVTIAESRKFVKRYRHKWRDMTVADVAAGMEEETDET